jgi:hypothetical protein
MVMQFNVFSKLKKINEKEIVNITTEDKNIIKSFVLSEKYPIFSYGISTTEPYRCLGKRMKFETPSEIEFNQFKDHLSYMTGFPTQKSLTEHPGPVFFQEFIKFDDNQGVIGTVICRKLYNDFRDNYDNAETYFTRLEESEQKFWKHYQNWCKALFVARQGGAISIN